MLISDPSLGQVWDMVHAHENGFVSDHLHNKNRCVPSVTPVPNIFSGSYTHKGTLKRGGFGTSCSHIPVPHVPKKEDNLLSTRKGIQKVSDHYPDPSLACMIPTVRWDR